MLPSFLTLAFSFQELNSRQLRVSGWGSPSSTLPPPVKQAVPCSTENTGSPVSFSQKDPDSIAMAEILPREKADQKNREIEAFPRKLIWETDMWSPDMLHWLSKSLFMG